MVPQPKASTATPAQCPANPAAPHPAAEPFKASAFKKVADIVDAHAEKITVSSSAPFVLQQGCLSPASRHRLGAWWNTHTLQHQHQHQYQYQHQASADCSPLCASQLNIPLFPGFHISRAWPSARRCPEPCVHALPAPQSASQLKGTKGVGPSSLAKITEVMSLALAPAARRSLARSLTPSPRCASGVSGWAAKLPAAPGAAGQDAQGQHA